jgi:hypothetical protein
VKTRKIIAALVAAFMVVAASAVPAQAAKKPAKTYNFKVTGTISGATGKTVLLIADTGRVLGSQSIVKAKQGLSITSSQKTSNLSGATLQLVTTSGGDYYGPVVLGWKSKTQVYTQFGTKTSGKGKYKVGTIVVSDASASRLQGYGKVKKKLSLIKKNVVAATNYKPAGVGTYGKTGGAPVSLLGDARGFVASGPIGDIDLRNVIPEDKKFDGGDADGDGLPNAFDVNDDGDAVLDQADANNPAPNAGANCEVAASLNVFTNFKSTGLNFAGNVNRFGSGSFEATDSNIANAMTSTLSVVMSNIQNVCGSPVSKTYFKGVGSVPYAPKEYVDITGYAGTDYQWTVGDGKIGGRQVPGLSSYAFTAPNEISGQDALVMKVVTADGKEYEFASSMGFVFITHPQPKSFTVGAGSAENVTYSGSSATFGVNATHNGQSGTNFMAVGSGPSQLKIEFRVPQRLAIDGESGKYWNLGNMDYFPDIPNGFGGSGGGPGKCDAQKNTDTRADSEATSEVTFIATFDLGRCFTDRGQAWTPGSTLAVDLQVVPITGGGNSAQKIGLTS